MAGCSYCQTFAAWRHCYPIMAWCNPHSFATCRAPRQPCAVWHGRCQTIAAQVPAKLPRLGVGHTSLRLDTTPSNHLWLGVVWLGVPAGSSRPGAAHKSLRLGAAPANRMRPGMAFTTLLRPGVPSGPSLPGASYIYLRLGAALAKLCGLASLSIHHDLSQDTHICIIFVWLGAASANHMWPVTVLAVLLRPRVPGQPTAAGCGLCRNLLALSPYQTIMA